MKSLTGTAGSPSAGLLGPNGAGQTITINIVLGVLEPGAGRVGIDGIDLARYSAQGGT